MKKTMAVFAVSIMLLAGTGNALASNDKKTTDLPDTYSCDIEWFNSLLDTVGILLGGDGWEDFWAGGDGWEDFSSGGDGWEDFWGGGDGWED